MEPDIIVHSRGESCDRFSRSDSLSTELPQVEEHFESIFQPFLKCFLKNSIEEPGGNTFLGEVSYMQSKHKFL